ncbi:hypothetical protein [Nioella sp.]|uniref:hypothetical protein n=1 Tax=Nioella sp. TaxID=1912091 RepID=UPI003A865E2D
MINGLQTTEKEGLTLCFCLQLKTVYVPVKKRKGLYLPPLVPVLFQILPVKGQDIQLGIFKTLGSEEVSAEKFGEFFVVAGALASECLANVCLCTS